jgi:hypothetical protein
MVGSYHLIGNHLAWLVGNGQWERLGIEPWVGPYEGFDTIKGVHKQLTLLKLLLSYRHVYKNKANEWVSKLKRLYRLGFQNEMEESWESCI